MPPELSIVIPSHSRTDLLRACLASIVRHQSVSTEIIVVDDGSPDGRVSTIASAVAGVQVVRLPQRAGFCAAANAGIRCASAAVVELLNDDTEVTAGWSAAALRHFHSNRVAAVAPLVLRWPGGDDARIDSAGDRYYLGGVAGKRGHGERLRPEFSKPCRVFGASASSAFYRRDVLLRVGAFPEEFGSYFEDVDLAFRLHRAGCDVICEPASRVLHHGGASHQPLAPSLVEQQSRNEERVFWRNLPLRDLTRAVPLHLAVLAGKAWRRWREGTLAPFLRGRLGVLGELPALCRHRRRLERLGPSSAVADWQVERRFWADPLGPL